MENENTQKTEKIERYLNGTLSVEEMKEFSEELSADESECAVAEGSQGDE